MVVSDLLPLERSFYERPTPEVARDLLGCVLVRDSSLDGGARWGVIVETEAYTGAEDPASHAARGPTPRNQVMFGEVGLAYVYFIYGCHHCLNVVAHPPGQAGAVLVRALAPLARGPGLLCKELSIDRGFTGWDLTRPSQLWIGSPGCQSGSLERGLSILSGTRVGIRKAVDRPWRFWVDGNRWVSGKAGRGQGSAVEPAIPRRTGRPGQGPEESI